MNPRYWLIAAGLFGAAGVAIGAFGAHGLPTYLERAKFAPEVVEKRVDTFDTGVRYHLFSAITLLAVAVAMRLGTSGWWRIAAALLLSGATIFSGLCYALSLVEGMRWLGAIVPIGGVAMILGWLAIAIAAHRDLHEA